MAFIISGTGKEKLTSQKQKIIIRAICMYLLTDRTFSAAALFSNAVKGQPGVVLVGEETGGGWHGNNGILNS